MTLFTKSALVASLLWASSANARGVSSHALRHFERRYIDSREYTTHNETIKLIGYKTISVPLHAQQEFSLQYDTHSANEDLDGYLSAYYEPDTGSLRVYFPVANALIEHDGELIEANELGEFDVEDIRGDYHVIGRKKTDTVHGHEGNIVKDGIVYLTKKAAPSHRHGKVFVYDFGKRNLDDHHLHQHDHHHQKRGEEEGRNDANGEQGEDAPTRGCIKNHGGINCSDAYKIYNGRCPFNKKTCMDYNGYFTNCKKNNRVMGFIGSDCFTSVSRGNCWNEMVGAEEDVDNFEKL